MVNYYDKHLFISKKKLAELADVSPRTFSRYLASRRHILEAMGISPKAQKLPPQAVKYICEDYCIDLPPELQNQQVLEKSPIYLCVHLALHLYLITRESGSDLSPGTN